MSRRSAPLVTAPPWFATFVPGRRGEILDAALAVFATRGYEGGTMREIASAVGVTEPALYRHWSGKEALFAELIAAAGDHVVAQAREGLALVSPALLRPAIGALLGMPMVPAERGRVLLMRAVVAAAPSRPVFAEAFRERLVRPMRAAVTATVLRLDSELGIDRAPGEVETRVRALMSLFVGYVVTTVMLEETGGEAATVEAALAVLGLEGAA